MALNEIKDIVLLVLIHEFINEFLNEGLDIPTRRVVSQNNLFILIWTPLGSTKLWCKACCSLIESLVLGAIHVVWCSYFSIPSKYVDSIDWSQASKCKNKQFLKVLLSFSWLVKLLPKKWVLLQEFFIFSFQWSKSVFHDLRVLL